MRKILFVVFLFFACSNPDNHGDLSIFKTPTTDQFDKWSNIDSVYKSTIKEMVDVYKKSGKLNFNGNPWDNKKFQSKYSDLTWRGLYDYYQYLYNLHNFYYQYEFLSIYYVHFVSVVIYLYNHILTVYVH